MTISALWAYQRERFPLSKTAPLLAVFSAASICVSALLANRELPGWGAFLAGFIIAMTLFFQMRVCDEVKDLDDDRRYRSERPIPRGLVSLRLIVGIGLASGVVTALAVGLWYWPALALLALVWAWLAAMTAEFGVSRWLKARPILYLSSHMMIMPLINVLLTGLEWMPHGAPPSGLVLFLGLSFVNGCVLEIGRKLWAPEREITGVDTYSGLWGSRMGATVWIACVLVAMILLGAVGAATGTVMISMLLGGAGVILCGVSAMAYVNAPTIVAAERIDKAAGLWTFTCYAIAAFPPLILRAL